MVGAVAAAVTDQRSRVTGWAHSGPGDGEPATFGRLTEGIELEPLSAVVETRDARRLAELYGYRLLAYEAIIDARRTILRACRDLRETGKLRINGAKHEVYDGLRLWQDLTWFFEDDGEWRDKYGLSYERACSVLGIEPEALRQQLRREGMVAYELGAQERQRRIDAGTWRDDVGPGDRPGGPGDRVGRDKRQLCLPGVWRVPCPRKDGGKV
jgi:hypothetical protein